MALLACCPFFSTIQGSIFKLAWNVFKKTLYFLKPGGLAGQGPPLRRGDKCNFCLSVPICRCSGCSALFMFMPFQLFWRLWWLHDWVSPSFSAQCFLTTHSWSGSWTVLNPLRNSCLRLQNLCGKYSPFTHKWIGACVNLRWLSFGMCSINKSYKSHDYIWSLVSEIEIMVVVCSTIRFKVKHKADYWARKETLSDNSYQVS